MEPNEDGSLYRFDRFNSSAMSVSAGTSAQAQAQLDSKKKNATTSAPINVVNEKIETIFYRKGFAYDVYFFNGGKDERFDPREKNEKSGIVVIELIKGKYYFGLRSNEDKSWISNARMTHYIKLMFPPTPIGRERSCLLRFSCPEEKPEKYFTYKFWTAEDAIEFRDAFLKIQNIFFARTISGEADCPPFLPIKSCDIPACSSEELNGEPTMFTSSESDSE